MADAGERRSLPLEARVAALVIAAAFPLARVFEPGGYARTVLVALALALGSAWLLRRARLPLAVHASASVLALLWFLAVVYVRDSLWGPFPTLGSMRAIGSAAEAGLQLARDEAAPVAILPPLMLLVSTGVWATTWTVYAAAVARNPLVAVAGALPMFAIPGAVVDSDSRWFDVALLGGAAAWMLFADERRRVERWALASATRAPGWRAGAAWRLGVLTIVLGLIVSPLLPGFADPPGLRGRGGGSGVQFNPIVRIKPTLDNDREVVLFTVRMSEPTYMRLTSLDTFDGDVWKQGDLRQAGPAGEGAVAIVEQDVRINALAGLWLPVAYRPVRTDAPAEPDQRHAALVVPRGVVVGTAYSAISAVPVPKPRDLASKADVLVNDVVAPYVALPPDVIEDLEPIARNITAGANTPYERAVALQQHLRRFTYDEDVADRHDFRTIRQFLTETKRGYCEQFAGSMAVLARTLGIPSRVVIGFGIGNEIEPDVYQVTTRHAHAWVELYFREIGWVAFEPTPRASVAQPGDYTFGQRDRIGRVGQPPEADPVPDPATPPDDEPANPGREPGAEEPVGAPAATVVVRGLRTAALIAAAVVFFVAAGLGVLALRRNRAMARASDPRRAIVMRYGDFLAWCRSAGLGRRVGETPREHAGRLGARVRGAAAPLERLASLVEPALWAPPNGHDPAEVDRAAREARRALSREIPGPRRVLAQAGWGRWGSV